MSIILWLFFVLLNGKLTWEIALLGAAVAALAFAFACAFLGWNGKRELRLLGVLPRLALYGAYLFLEIVRANLATLRRIYSRREPEPAVVTFQTKLKPRWQRVLLANSITLTPGTITLEETGDRLTVHCLNRGDADSLSDSEMERRIGRMEVRG